MKRLLNAEVSPHMARWEERGGFERSLLSTGSPISDRSLPFKRLRVSYEGELLLLDDPHAMADPSAAFKRYPKRPALIALEFEGASPMQGGELVQLDGQPLALDPEHSVFRGHTEQQMAVRGRITVDDVSFEIGGMGYRDKSWGPRH